MQHSSETVQVWEWRPGMTWRRVLEIQADGRGAIADALTDRPNGCTRATFATVLGIDPNHLGGLELIEYAEQIAGVIPDTTPRRRHA